MYERHPHLVHRSSLLEYLLLIVWRARQQVMISGVRAQAQASLGGEEAAKAFTEFRDLVNHVEVNEKKDQMKEVMKKWSQVPEVRFAPVQTLGRPRSVRSVRREMRDLNLLPADNGIKPLKDPARPIRALKKGKQ